MSGRDDRELERVAIRERVELASIGIWVALPGGDDAAGHAVDQLGAIATAICNLAETVDDRLAVRAMDDER
ncbi:hypothetical protein LCGC14_1749180 [marine sediment metagenome]|uniref:Uncharacterized protein n=2 Tax=root TaxID=1 RepID=A0A9C9THC6_9HYPH|nr:hypothetical protein [Aurantimonas coralicida]